MSCSPPRDACQNPAGPTQRFEHVTHRRSLHFAVPQSTYTLHREASGSSFVFHLFAIQGALGSWLLVLGSECALSWWCPPRSVLRHRRTLATSVHVSYACLAECFQLLCRSVKAILSDLQVAGGKSRSHSAAFEVILGGLDCFTCKP